MAQNHKTSKTERENTILTEQELIDIAEIRSKMIKVSNRYLEEVLNGSEEATAKSLQPIIAFLSQNGHALRQGLKDKEDTPQIKDLRKALVNLKIKGIDDEGE